MNRDYLIEKLKKELSNYIVLNMINEEKIDQRDNRIAELEKEVRELKKENKELYDSFTNDDSSIPCTVTHKYDDIVFGPNHGIPLEGPNTVIKYDEDLSPTLEEIIPPSPEDHDSLTQEEIDLLLQPADCSKCEFWRLLSYTSCKDCGRWLVNEDN